MHFISYTRCVGRLGNRKKRVVGLKSNAVGLRSNAVRPDLSERESHLYVLSICPL